MVLVYRMYTSIRNAAWWIMVRIVGTVWGAAVIAGYGQKDKIGVYTLCGYCIFEMIANTGVTWSLYPTNWMTEIDDASF